mmetsp:Transcript_14019/g.16986  ORF Transcript_14019/g.16986 Transcript_14019/m.16986 type:complete len:93 (+) Transcript_14019:1649-1927(+)
MDRSSGCIIPYTAQDTDCGVATWHYKMYRWLEMSSASVLRCRVLLDHEYKYLHWYLLPAGIICEMCRRCALRNTSMVFIQHAYYVHENNGHA